MNELIRCGWSKVKGQGHIGLSSVTFSGSPYFRNAWRESQYHRVFFSGMEQWSMSWTGGLDTGPSWWRRIWTGRWRSQFTNPTLTCGHELWVVTQRTRWWIQVDEMSVRLMVAVLGLEPQLHWWFWHLIRISPGRLPLEVLWRPLGRPRILWGDYTSHLAWECLGITWKTSGIPECHRDLTPDKWKTMDGVQYWPEERSCSGLCW